MDQKKPPSKRVGPEEPRGLHKGGGRALPPRRALRPCGPLVDSPDLFSMRTPLIYPQTSKTEPRSGVLPPQASVATKNQSGYYSDTLPEGDPSPVAIFIIPALYMTRRE